MAFTGRRAADEKLVIALACGSTVENAARQAGVGETTVYRRLKEPAFQAMLNTARQEMIQRTANMLTAASLESVKTLLRLQGEGVPHAVQLGAAKAIVELGAKLRESAELFARVAALEQQLATPAA
jgi:hypothetical protein